MMTEQKLIELGFNPAWKGFYYLKDAVNMTVTNKFVKKMFIYSSIAETYGDTKIRVERAIRNCIKKSKSIYNNDPNSMVFSKLAILVKSND